MSWEDDYRVIRELALASLDHPNVVIEGLPLLAWAVHSDDPELVGVLLRAGADPNLLATDGCPALGWGGFEVTRLLVASGARVVPDPKWGSALHLAADDETSERLRLLLTAPGASDCLDHFEDSCLCWTPLASAAASGRLDNVRLLLDAGAAIDAHDDLNIGSTALEVACSKGQWEVARYLVSQGASADIPLWMQLTTRDRLTPEQREMIGLSPS